MDLKKIYSWNDISIEQSLDIESVRKMTWYNDYRDLDKFIDLASIVTGEPIEYFENMTQLEWNVVSDNVIKFLATPIEPEISNDARWWQTPYYILNGTKYCVTYFDYSPKESIKHSKKKTARYIDFTTSIAVDKEDLVSALSCILIPEGKEYGDYDIESVKSDIANYLSIPKAVGLFYFFLYALLRYRKTIQFFSMALMKIELKKQIKKLKKIPEVEIERKKLEEALQLCETTLLTGL